MQGILSPSLISLIASRFLSISTTIHPSSNGILARQHPFKVLAMNNDTPAVTALFLVPFLIAISAAFWALKISHLSKGIARALKRAFRSKLPSSARRSRKLRRSNLTSSQTYADSWVDLESNAPNDHHLETFINQSPVRKLQHSSSESGCGIDTSAWHPNRNARLTWSFVNPTSPTLRRSESSSVARPLPVAQRPERLSGEDVDSLFVLTKVEAAHQ